MYSTMQFREIHLPIIVFSALQETCAGALLKKNRFLSLPQSFFNLSITSFVRNFQIFPPPRAHSTCSRSLIIARKFSLSEFLIPANFFADLHQSRASSALAQCYRFYARANAIALICPRDFVMLQWAALKSPKYRPLTFVNIKSPGKSERHRGHALPRANPTC